MRLAVAAATNLTDQTGLRGTPVPRVEWQNRAKASRIVSGAWGELRFYAPAGLGIDETRYEMNEAETALVPTYCGLRTFNVQVLLQASSQEPTADAVGVLAGRLRTRIRRAEILAVLQAAGVSMIGVGPTLEVDYTDANGREVSASSTEMYFSCVESDTDEEYDAGWIDNLEADGTLEPSFDDDEIEVPIVHGEIT